MLTLITGPPNSGRTLVAVRLAADWATIDEDVLFVTDNKTEVLNRLSSSGCCIPSNVDVVHTNAFFSEDRPKTLENHLAPRPLSTYAHIVLDLYRLQAGWVQYVKATGIDAHIFVQVMRLASLLTAAHDASEDVDVSYTLSKKEPGVIQMHCLKHRDTDPKEAHRTFRVVSEPRVVEEK